MSGIGLPVREWKGTTIPVEMDDNTVILLDFGESRFGFAYGANCRGGALPRFAIFGSDGTVAVGAPGARRPAASGTEARPRSSVTVSSRHVEGGEMELELSEMPYRVGPHREIGEARSEEPSWRER